MVLGIDGCSKMLESARNKRETLHRRERLTVLFVHSDIHCIKNPFLLGHVSGIWSCAALFTHTPKALIPKVLQSTNEVLEDGGIFAVSYTQGFQERAYNKLLLSRTGRIKYFSQPMAATIENEVSSAGFKLIYQTQDNFDREGKLVAKNLFVTQFFRKE